MQFTDSWKPKNSHQFFSCYCRSHWATLSNVGLFDGSPVGVGTVCVCRKIESVSLCSIRKIILRSASKSQTPQDVEWRVSDCSSTCFVYITRSFVGLKHKLDSIPPKRKALDPSLAELISPTRPLAMLQAISKLYKGFGPSKLPETYVITHYISFSMAVHQHKKCIPPRHLFSFSDRSGKF